MSASAHERDKQRKWLQWTGAIASAFGLLASPMSLWAAAPSSSQFKSSGDPQDMYELLPRLISGVMDSPADVCPTSWKSATEAKEMIVYLTEASKLLADDRELSTNMNKPGVPPQAAAYIARMISENRTHANAMTACRDAIAEKLGMDNAAVQQLYDYNTMTAAETKMFNDLETHYNEQPNYFSNLLAMSDQRKALHLIELEVRELDYGLAEDRQMLGKDTGKPTHDTDQEILSRDTIFRKALLVVRASIEMRLKSAAP